MKKEFIFRNRTFKNKKFDKKHLKITLKPLNFVLDYFKNIFLNVVPSFYSNVLLERLIFFWVGGLSFLMLH